MSPQFDGIIQNRLCGVYSYLIIFWVFEKYPKFWAILSYTERSRTIWALFDSISNINKRIKKDSKLGKILKTTLIYLKSISSKLHIYMVI